MERTHERSTVLSLTESFVVVFSLFFNINATLLSRQTHEPSLKFLVLFFLLS